MKLHSEYVRNKRNCLSCERKYIPTGQCQKFCGSCRETQDKLRMKKYHKDTYIRKGYTLKGPAHPNWKDGIGVYKNMKEKKACERCGSKKYLLIHHRDHNRRNNIVSNLECLCKGCHQNHHLIRDAKGKFSGSVHK